VHCRSLNQDHYDSQSTSCDAVCSHNREDFFRGQSCNIFSYIFRLKGDNFFLSYIVAVSSIGEGNRSAVFSSVAVSCSAFDFDRQSLCIVHVCCYIHVVMKKIPLSVL
jgi:hypothetical protein